MKWFGKTVLFGAMALALSGCLAGSAAAAHVGAYGWWAQAALGFWHGLIAPLTFSMSLLDRFFPNILHALPYKLWGPWYAYDFGQAGFAYTIGFFFGLLFLPSLLMPRPKF